jgi:hypothetical protein
LDPAATGLAGQKISRIFQGNGIGRENLKAGTSALPRQHAVRTSATRPPSGVAGSAFALAGDDFSMQAERRPAMLAATKQARFASRN